MYIFITFQIQMSNKDFQGSDAPNNVHPEFLERRRVKTNASGNVLQEEHIKTNHTQFIPRSSTDMKDNPEMVERLREIFHDLFQWIRSVVMFIVFS
jgi:hypothetical protein